MIRNLEFEGETCWSRFTYSIVKQSYATRDGKRESSGRKSGFMKNGLEGRELEHKKKRKKKKMERKNGKKNVQRAFKSIYLSILCTKSHRIYLWTWKTWGAIKSQVNI